MNKEQRAAWVLFREGIPQNDIAAIFGKSEKTISAWAIKFEWLAKRNEYQLSLDSKQERIQKIIDFQLRVLDRITEQRELILEDEGLGEAELQKLLISKGDIDAFQKLWTTIKFEEQEWSAVVRTIHVFVEHIQKVDLELSKQVAIAANDFFKSLKRG